MIGSGGKTSNRQSALIQTEPTELPAIPNARFRFDKGRRSVGALTKKGLSPCVIPERLQSSSVVFLTQG